MDAREFVQAVIVGVITGLFSAGAVYGAIKVELRWLRSDVNAIKAHLWPEHRPHDRSA